MAENFIERGLKVTLVEAAPHILAPFDSEMVTIAEKKLEDHGVTLILGDAVQAFEELERQEGDSPGAGQTESGQTETGLGGKGRQVTVHLQSGLSLTANIIMLAIGVTPDTSFLKDSGIVLGTRGHIVVNEYMQTNVAGIYAVGDAVEITDFITGLKAAIPLAGPANKQGRIAADHICSLNSSYKGTQGTAIIKIFDLTAASTGSNERALKRMDAQYHVVYVHPNSHAGYYPGAAPMTLKLLFDSKGKVLGAQAMGSEGVDKRIDVIATIIRLGGTIYDMIELELSYAPPYSSAKDPVNMAGYLAENVLAGRHEVFTIEELPGLDRESTILLDVRNQDEYDRAHLEGAVHIPVDALRGRLDELDSSKEIYTYCEVGQRGYIASRILQQSGYRVRNLTGGHRSYRLAAFTPAKDKLIQ
jgi:pyruvate/2-oxoglutarate dehydrogenase complex dihydrolipoamide dehydrogenase (E3) component/rhodanese-related sulfurtransferase